jgi:hypothetical protein
MSEKISDDKVVYPDFSTTDTEKPEAVKFTEDAQAKAFVDIQNGTMRYVKENEQWFIHNGNYWEEVYQLSVIEAARPMNRGTAIAINKDPRIDRHDWAPCRQ